MRLPALAAGLALATACAPELTEFPAGLAPLEENQAPLPDAGFETVSSVAEDYVLAHGRGWIEAPMAEAWEALQTADVVVDRRRVDTWTSEVVPDPEVDASFVVHHVVHDLLTVEYDVTWREGAVAGEPGAPEVVGLRWQKTWGTSLIEVMEGSGVLTADRDRTELQLVYHLGAQTTAPDELELFLRDVWTSADAVARGEALPTWD